ncbi:hypothetical protein K503DRAFT_600143 [Rhizopogon vinicolor AM-OR11-026]|uniref:Uncharacterized protein n=1 Tax=Rhizopogon vinicolor AM-OR11-026 TaxID=1314800 RepID=A0A1B7MIW1_9AGAM|nr:hypothetical protein K503DRAFT_600143 [Rhizopogon vinicolor AM-OR11-026]
MVNVVDNEADVGSIAKPNRTITFGLSMALVGAIAGITSALSGPTALIVVLIIATVVIGTWVYDVYQLSYVLSAYPSSVTRITEPAQPGGGGGAPCSLHRGFNAHPTNALSSV